MLSQSFQTRQTNLAWQGLSSARLKVKCMAASARRGTTIDKISSSRLQELYSTAKKVLRQQRQLSSADVQAVKDALAVVPLSELGLEAPVNPAPKASSSFSGWLLKRHARSPSITYLHIHEDPDVSIGIFCLPQHAALPLHSHPGMTVFSRVLYGSMHVRGLDWISQEQLHGSAAQQPLAAVAVDTVLDAHSPPTALFPHAGGNIHQFTAVTATAVLDVLAPPYLPGRGRDCTYYAESPAGNGKVRLKAVDPGSEFIVNSSTYHGLHIDPMR